MTTYLVTTLSMDFSVHPADRVQALPADYCEFRLCMTPTDYGGFMGIGLSPYPYRLHPKHGYTVGEGLFSLLKSLLETMPYEGCFTPPVEDYQIDKLTVMELEMLGIKVEPKALLQYSAYSTQDEDQGFGLFY